MNSRSPSSAELIGQVEDTIAQEALLATANSFELTVRASELEEQIARTPDLSKSAYIGLMCVGPFALYSPAVWNAGINAYQRRKVTRLKNKAAEILPPITDIN